MKSNNSIDIISSVITSQEAGELLAEYKKLTETRVRIRAEREELTKRCNALLKDLKEVETKIRDISEDIEKLPYQDVKSHCFKEYPTISSERLSKVWDKAYKFNDSDTLSEQAELFHGFMELIIDL